VGDKEQVLGRDSFRNRLASAAEARI